MAVTPPAREQGRTPLTLSAWPHPLTAEGCETRRVAVRPGQTLEGLAREEARRLGLDIDRVEIALNGLSVARAAWAATPLGAGDLVILRAVAGNSGLLRILGTILIVAAAAYIPGALGLTGWAATAASAGIYLVGGLVLNALVPPELPGAEGGEQPTPVYSLGGGANRARLYEPLPLVLGRHRMFPDLGAAEHTEYRGGDQYLASLFNFGLGDLEVSDLRIGPTPLSSYEGAGADGAVETEWAGADGAIGLVPGNVDTVHGAALEGTGWVERVAKDTGRIAIDITGRIFRLRKGRTVEHSVDIEIEWRLPGQPAAATSTVTLANDSQTPLRETLVRDLPSRDDWTVRVRRTTEPDGDEYVYDDVTWGALRAYQADDADYAGQTRLGARIRASGQLFGRLSALVQQRVPVYAAGEWGSANLPTSNPAAILRWFARGIRVGGRLRAGLGLPDERIDHEALAAWHDWCQAQKLRCDYVVQGSDTAQRVLALIARCGRAAPTWATGKLGVVWEDADRPPTGMVTPGNVVAGSMRVVYTPGKIADEIAVRYVEPAMDWQWNTVRRSRPGLAGTPTSTATLTLKGVTTADRAAVMCNLHAARQEYHRRTISWEMGPEGRYYPRGSVVWITHGLIDGGIAGRLVAGTADRIVLDRPVEVGDDAWVLLRAATGALGQSPVSAPAGAAGQTRELVLDAALEDPPADGGSPSDVLWRLYDATEPPRRVRIIAHAPTMEGRYRLTAIDEVAAYHTLATSDLTAPFPAARPRTPRVLQAVFMPERIRIGQGDMIRLHIALTVDGPWEGGIVRAGPSWDRLELVATLTGGATETSWIVPPGQGQAVEIVPGAADRAAGPRWRGTWGWETGPLPPPPTQAAVSERPDGIRLYTWIPPDIPDLAGILIRHTAGAGSQVPWADMTPLHAGYLTSSPYASADPPGGTYTLAFRALSTAGEMSAIVRVDAALGEPHRLVANVFEDVREQVLKAIRDNPALAGLDAEIARARALAEIASTKATEAATSASAAAVSGTHAETASAAAKTESVRASAARTAAQNAASAARLSQTAAATLADDAREAVAGLEATVTAEVDKDLRSRFAAIVALRAQAGSSDAALELVALSDASGDRAEGIINASLRSDRYVPGAAGWIIRRDGRAEFDAAAIRGRLQAAQISSNVFNVRRIFSGSAVFTRAGTPIVTSPPIDNFDTLLLGGSGHGGRFLWSVSVRVAALSTARKQLQGVTGADANWSPTLGRASFSRGVLSLAIIAANGTAPGR